VRIDKQRESFVEQPIQFGLLDFIEFGSRCGNRKLELQRPSSGSWTRLGVER
jgi:hypothetical protein